MKKRFYDRLVEVESVYIALDELKLAPHEKAELSELVDSQIHHTVLDLILSHLSPEDKKKFLMYHASNRHDEVWDLLNKRIDKVEDKITETIAELKKKLKEDIHRARSGRTSRAD